MNALKYFIIFALFILLGCNDRNSRELVDEPVTIAADEVSSEKKDLKLVYVWAQYCGVCVSTASPMVDALKEKNIIKIEKVETINGDEKEVLKLEVEVLPTFVIFDGKKIVGRKNGSFASFEAFEAWVKSF